MPEFKSKNKKAITLYTLIAFLSYAFIYSRYLDALNTTGLSVGLSLYIDFSFWLHFLVFASIAFLLVFFTESVLERNRAIYLVLLAVTGSLLTIYLYIDSTIYSAMNLHLNRFVVAAIAQEDALNEIGISPKLLAFTVLPVLVFISVHLLISPLSGYSLLTVRFGRRGVIIFFLVLAAFVSIDKLLFAYFYYKAQPFVFQLRDAPPAYLAPHPYHISKLYGYLLGGDPKINFTEPMEGLVAASEPGKLNYPAAQVVNGIVTSHHFNIVIVVIESLRQHDVDSITAPFYSKLAKETIQSRHHYTGGNTTHFGLFSLLYGLNPYYFHDFRLSKVPPVGISLLRENGYSVYSSTARSMRWYDMDKFMLGNQVDAFIPEDGKNYERDKQITDRSIELARVHQATGNPYLNFIYYYTTHADYDHPGAHTIFEPELKGRVDYSDLELRGAGRQKLVNRYRNAIHSIDSELDRLVTGIQEAGAWDNTIVIITSDHGEEFFEESSFGHNTNLNEYQMRVPFLMHIPGKGHIDIDKPTSHMDVFQTVLEEVFNSGIEKLPFQGRNMLSGENGFVYVAKAHYQRPDAYAILGNGQKVVVNLQGGFLEVESVSPDGGSAQGVNSDMRSGIIGLLKQIRQLKK